jgi:hypothetical protein
LKGTVWNEEVMDRKKLIDGYRFTQAPEVGSPYATLTVRLPMPGVPQADYRGADAAERLSRFVKNFDSAKHSISGEPLVENERKHLQELRRDAMDHLGVPVALVMRAWYVVLVYGLPYNAQWMLSTQLAPRGRMHSEDGDWADLGKIVAVLGVPGGPVQPIESLHPTEPIKWGWAEEAH